jgi:hypothetical protein
MSNNKIELKKKSKAKIYEHLEDSEAAGYNTNANTNMSYSIANSNKTLSDQGELIFIGDGWASFPDLDNFDSDLLLRILTLKVKLFQIIKGYVSFIISSEKIYEGLRI